MMFDNLKKKMPGKVSDREADLVASSSDASQIKGSSVLVVWPRSVRDVHDLVFYANRHNLNIVPRGAATGLVGGAVSQNSIVLDFSRMNHFEINDNKAVVQPGLILDDLNKGSLVFPVQPGSHKVCTIGGMIATNAVGMRSAKYGRVIDWVEYLEIVDGSGKHFKVRGENIKNFCGLEGTTGIVVGAGLRLIQRPDLGTVSILRFDNISTTMKKVSGLIHEKVLSLEFIDRYCSEFLGLNPKNHLFVEYEENKGLITDPEEIKEVWNKRDSLYPSIASNGYSVIEDPKIPLKNMDKFLFWLRKNKIPSYGHIHEGIIHSHFRSKNDKEISVMYGLVKELDGDVSGEHGIGLSKKRFVSEKFRERVKKLKEIYDPKNILNRGKIL